MELLTPIMPNSQSQKAEVHCPEYPIPVTKQKGKMQKGRRLTAKLQNSKKLNSNTTKPEWNQQN